MHNAKNIITIDQIALLGPLMAGEILNAYYSALLLKQQRGEELTLEIEQKTLTDVFLLWAEILTILEKKLPQIIKPLETSEDQEH